MNQLIKKIIEEKAKALRPINTKPKKATKKVKKEVDEIVDEDGNIDRNPKPINANVKGITSYSTTDGGAGRPSARDAGFGSLGGNIPGGNSNKSVIKYWIEEEDMSDILGHEVLDQNLSYDEAEEYFENELEIDPAEAKERLNKMGLDKELPEDQIRLVENPKQFVQDYLESIMARRSKENDVLEKNDDDRMDEKEPNPIILKQLSALKDAIKADGLSVNHILAKYLKDE